MEKVKTNDNYYELIDIGRFFFLFTIFTNKEEEYND